MTLRPTQKIFLLCLAAFIASVTAGPAVIRAEDKVPPQPSQEVLDAMQYRAEAVKRASRATVAVFGLQGDGGGSGVIVSPEGYAVTNFHVTSPFGTKMRCGLNDGKIYESVVVSVDPTGDTAMIKLLGRDDFPVAEMGDSDLVQIGDWCFAIGNPFVLATNLQPTVTFGLISGTHRYQYPSGTILEYADCLQTDAAINPGNSGGPLFNAAGQLIGINGRCSFEKRGRINVGVGYAISINQVKNFLGYLHSGRILDHATLGATVASDDNGKVVVSNILSSSDAYRRGLRYGDEVLEFAGREVSTVNEFKNILGTLPRDWRVPIKFRHNDRTIETLVRLTGVHTADELDELNRGGLPGMPTPDEPPKPKKKPKSESKGQPTEEKLEAPEEDSESDVESKDEAEAEDKPVSKENMDDYIDLKPGFTNYFFNQQEQDRVWKRLNTAENGTLVDNDGEWGLEGTLAGEPTPFSVRLSDNELLLSIDGIEQVISKSTDWSAIVERRRQDGVLVGLRIWQQLMAKGPGKVGQTTYAGTFPLSGKRPLRDVLIINISDVEAYVYFSPDTGLVECIEAFGERDVDPIEVYFDQYQALDGRQIPKRIRLQYGTEPVMGLDVSKFSTTEKSDDAQ